MKKSNDHKSFGTQSGASFRDPSGFIFKGEDGKIYRQINKVAAKDFDFLIKSKLYEQLVRDNLLVEHEVVNDYPLLGDAYKILEPKQVQFISYPFEWSFSQLKDAALLTLKLQKLSLQKGLSLKDASAYNVQFLKGKPIFIDTLSFEKYQDSKAWVAYKQFCQHFFAPLVLMAYTDVKLNQLSRVFIDGVPLDLAVKLLPAKAKLKPSIAMHIVLHAKAQKAKASERKRPIQKVPLKNQLAILDNLERSIKKLKLRSFESEWADYYNNTNYSSDSADQKSRIINDFIKNLDLKSAIDLGGNNGFYTRLLTDNNINCVCADYDANAVEANYLHIKKTKETQMLSVCIDLTNPGGCLGWGNNERSGIEKRYKADLAMALAIVHHLAISNNLPLAKIADYFSKFAPYLIIEFVPKEDSQVQKLLSTREDVFPNYTEADFVKSFKTYYELKAQEKIKGSKRTLYLFKKK